MAYGVRPPHLGEWIVNLGEAAEYMFDHNIFQENLVGVDFCEKMVRETNPGVWEKAEKTEAPHAGDHGYRTIGDIMKSLNPFEGEFYREALQMSRMTREMFCLMEGRHVHPSTLYPGGVGTVRHDPALHRLPDPPDEVRRVHEEGRADARRPVRLLLRGAARLRGGGQAPHPARLLGRVPGPRVCNFEYRDMTDWGRKMFVTPGIVVDGKLVTTDLVEINLGIRILLGSSYYDDWDGQGDVRHAAIRSGNPVDARHPWNQHTIPRPQKRDFDDKYTWVMSPRWYDGKDHLALDTGGGPLARLWATALAGLVDIGYVKATGNSVKINLPEDRAQGPGDASSGRSRSGATPSSAIARAPTSRPTPPAARCTSSSKALEEVRAGHTKTWDRVQGARRRPSAAASPRRCAACSRTTWSSATARSPTTTPTRRRRGTRARATSTARPGPYEDAMQGTPIFEENGRDNFKGIDIMRDGAQLRSVPAVRRAHVPRRRAGAEDRAHPDGRPHRSSLTEPPCPPRRMRRRWETGSALLLGQVREAVNARTRERVEELVRLLLELHARGLDRAMELLDERSRRTLAANPLVSSLLVLHDLHPDDAHTRIQRALDRVRPYLGSHAGGIEFLGVDGAGVAHLRLEGSCNGCPSSTVTVKLAIEQAVLEAAPEIERLDVEGVAAPRQAAPDGSGAWRSLAGAEGLPDGSVSSQLVDGAQVLVCRAKGTLFAFRDGCARCGSGLEARRARWGHAGLPRLPPALRRAEGRARAGGPRQAPVSAPAAGGGRRRPGGAPRGADVSGLAALRRLRQRRPRTEAEERCQLCAAPLGETHAHLVVVDTRALLCTCPPCHLLFGQKGAGGGKYRGVPQRYLHEPVQISPADWEALQIPVRMAFLFRNSSLGRMVAFYPSPAGATESLSRARGLEGDRRGPRRWKRWSRTSRRCWFAATSTASDWRRSSSHRHLLRAHRPGAAAVARLRRGRRGPWRASPFFADLRGRVRGVRMMPASAMPASRSGSRTPAPEPYAQAPDARPSAFASPSPRAPTWRASRSGARCASSRTGAATRPRSRSSSSTCSGSPLAGAQTLRPFLLDPGVGTLVPRFAGSCRADLPVPFTLRPRRGLRPLPPRAR